MSFRDITGRRKLFRFTLIIVVAPLLLLFTFIPHDLAYANDPSYDWEIVEITDGRVPPYTPYRKCASLAIDKEGNPHICFGQDERKDNDGPTHIIYTYRKDGVWHSEELTSERRSVAETCISVDNNGKVHIAYATHYGAGIWYMTNESGSWVERRFVGEWTGNYVSLYLDDSGRPHLCYNWKEWNIKGDLYYLWKERTWWRGEGVGGYFGGWGTEFAALAVSHGTTPIPHIVGERATHFFKTPEGWKSESLGLDSHILDDPNGQVALDSKNTFYCILQHHGHLKSPSNLILAKKQVGGKLFYENIPGGISSLAIDSQDRLHGAIWSSGTFFYGLQNSHTWAFQKIDIGMIHWTSDVTLKLNNNGLPRIVFSLGYDWGEYEAGYYRIYYAEAYEKRGLPLISPISTDQRVAEGEILELTVTAINPNGNRPLELSFDIQGMPKDLQNRLSTATFETSFNATTSETSGILKWRPETSWSAIYYPVVFVARDPETGKSARKTMTIVVHPKNSIPVLSGESIQKAIDNSKSGDIIYVYYGLYGEEILVKNKEIVLRGENIFGADIDGNIVVEDSNLSIENLRIFYRDAGFLSYSSGNYVDFKLLNYAGITAINSEIRVKDCIIQPQNYLHFYFLSSRFIPYFLPEPSGKGIQIWNLYKTRDISPIVENNYILNADTAVYLFTQTFGGSILGEIKNNTLDSNNCGILLRMHKERPTIANNIITRSKDAIDITYNSLLKERLARILNNCFGAGNYSNTHNVWCDELEAEQLALPDEKGNIAEDPGYQSRAFPIDPANPNCRDKGFWLR